MGKIRILIVDECAFCCARLRALLERNADMRVVAEARHESEAFALVENKKPDLILIGCVNRELDRCDLKTKLLGVFANIKILSIRNEIKNSLNTEDNPPETNTRYSRDVNVDRLSATIRDLTYGGRLPAATNSDRLSRVENNDDTLSPLTPRQREILKLVAEGNSTKEIGYSLQISIKTVDAHRGEIMRRLHIYNVPDLVRFAMRHGLVSM